jgi:hypothetical protein
LVTTAFNIGYAIVLVCIVFGWSGGSKLVKDSYAGAKVKGAEMTEERRDKRTRKKEEKRRAREESGGLVSRQRHYGTPDEHAPSDDA